jgi:16S rRNA processing protein RimM
MTERSDADRQAEKIILGRISGVHGVQGWVKVYSWTDPMESIVDYSPWYIRPQDIKAGAGPGADNGAAWQKIKVKSGRKQGKTVVAKLEHCNDRDEAQALIGYEIAIEPGQLETLDDENEFYWRDLIGLRVVNHQQEELGVVQDLMETGVNDVLVVFSEKDQRERLIPWTPGHAVESVDRDAKVIYVDWDADF